MRLLDMNLPKLSFPGSTNCLVFADLFAVPLVNDSFQGQHLSDIALLLGLDRFHLWILLRKQN